MLVVLLLLIVIFYVVYIINKGKITSIDMMTNKVVLNVSSNVEQRDKLVNKITGSVKTSESGDILSTLPDDIRENITKGDVKITHNTKKKTIKYENGKMLSDEELNSNDTFEKKAINKCPNCGASLDLDQDKCMYCGTKIN